MENGSEKLPQIFIKANEDKEVKDFTFLIPQECPFLAAKQALIIAFEHVVKLEIEAAAKKQEESVKAEEVAVEANDGK